MVAREAQFFLGVLAGVATAWAAGAAVSAAFVAPLTAPQHGPQQHLNQLAKAAEAAPAGAAARPARAAAKTAQRDGEWAALKWLGAGLAAGSLVAAFSAPADAIPAFTGSRWAPEKFTIKAAKHLDLCKDNKKYHKKIKDQIYKITQRQKKYPQGSVVFNRLEKKIAGVKAREEAYGDRYCGKKDGRPRVIATGENVRGGVVVPSLMFLYTAGWIGWAGRSYLIRTQDEKKELNIDVPLALTCMASGFSWPVACWQDIVNGELVVKDTDLHRSFF